MGGSTPSTSTPPGWGVNQPPTRPSCTALPCPSHSNRCRFYGCLFANQGRQGPTRTNLGRLEHQNGQRLLVPSHAVDPPPSVNGTFPEHHPAFFIEVQCFWESVWSTHPQCLRRISGTFFFLTVDVSWTQGGGKVGGGVGGRALASQETKGNNLCAGHHRHAEDVGRAALRPHRGEPDGAADGPPPPGAVLTHGWGGGAEQETGAGQPLDEFGGVCILHFAFCSVHLHLERLSMVIVFTTNKCQ